MKISNVRLGFATNSSSSHSIILLKKPIVGRESKDYNGFYGSSGDILTSKQEVIRYFASMMRTSMQKSGINEHMSNTIATELFNVSKDDLNGIDHQSHINFNIFPELLWNQILEYLNSGRIAVLLTGDDYTPSIVSRVSRFLRKQKENIILDFNKIVHTSSTPRFKQDGDWWVVFNPNSGTKLRFSLVSPYEYEKSNIPELVDLKITDFCKSNCCFCYQDSTHTGKHSDMWDIRKIVNMLKRQGVFEIAIGGGDPLSYPHLKEIISYINGSGIISNISFNGIPHTWEKDRYENYIYAINHCGSYGVSCSDPYDVNRIEESNYNDQNLFEYCVSNLAYTIGNRYLYNKAVVQHVFGSVPAEETIKIISFCNARGISLLLLGFKSIGRGAKVTPCDQTKTMKWVINNKKYFNFNLSVDTKMIELYPEFVKKVCDSDLLISPGEGLFSKYIDAVNMTYGDSSYGTEFKKLSDDLTEFNWD